LDANQPAAVHEQSAQIPGRGIWYPDCGEAIVTEQVEDVPGVTAVRLGLANDHGADLGRVPDDHRVTEPLHEGMEPDRVAGAFDADGDGSRQSGVEVLDDRSLVRQPVVVDLPGRRVEYGDLLLSRVKIAAHEYHGVGLLSVSAVCLPDLINSAEGPF